MDHKLMIVLDDFQGQQYGCSKCQVYYPTEEELRNSLCYANK